MFSSILCSRRKRRNRLGVLPGKGVIPTYYPRMTKSQCPLLSGAKFSLESTPIFTRKRRHMKAFSSNPKIVELDPSFSGLVLHLRSYVQILREHLTIEDGVKISKLGNLAGITGAIKACQDVSFSLFLLLGLPLFFYCSGC